MADPVSLAKLVLSADAAPGATLSLAPGMPPVTVDTQVADARRNYMRLAALIHPDKLKGSFEKATEAFQMLVRAFEAFADPTSRKKAFASAAKKGSGTVGRASKSTKGKPEKKKTRAEKTKTPVTRMKRKPVKKTASDDEDVSDGASETEDDDEETPASSEDEFQFSDDEQMEPIVSNSRTPIGQPRTGADYTMTIIGCPNCRSPWEPDTRQQYSLFMGEWDKKVHCQLCLFVFGSATALHNCPHCQAAFDYDASMYNTVIDCRKCKRRIGFPYYPVSQHLIDQVRLEQWRARKEIEKAQERERRHRGRQTPSDPAAAAEAQMQMWVGACVVNEECPLCRARVRRHHRQHIEECAKKQGSTSTEAGPDGPTASDKVTKASPAKSRSKAVTKTSRVATETKAKKTPSPAKQKTSVAKKATPAARAKPTRTKKAKPAVGKKTKRRGSSDDDDDGDEDSFSDEDESSESESSFSDEDDDFSSDDE